MSADPITPEAIASWFAFHPATETTGVQHDLVRGAVRTCAEVLATVVPPGAHRTIAIRKLQEAMWAANAGVACDQPPRD